jgi:hypothetical protein
MLVSTLVYQSDIQIYSQISIPRSWSKSKCHHAFSLDLSLMGVKLARNVTKVVVRECLQMGHPNLCSIFNSKKLVKVVTRPHVFTTVGLKGGENRSERNECWCGRLSTNGTSKTILKFQFREIGQS